MEEQVPQINSIRLRVSHNDTYEKAFDTAYNTLKTLENYENKIPFIFLGVAYLEYCLNLTIIDFFENEFPEQYAEKFAGYYLKSISLNAKIDLLPSILSHNQFITDPQNDSVQAVSLLVKVRNKVTHRSDFYDTINITQNDNSAALFDFSTVNDDLSKVSLSNIDRVYKAVKSYVNEVCEQYSTTKAITKGDIIKATR